MSRAKLPGGGRRRLGLFDGFVLAGALVNGAVVVVLLGYWILH